MKRRISGILLTLGIALMLLSAFPVQADAASVGDFEVTGGIKDKDYSFSDGVLTIKSGAPLVISMKKGKMNTTHCIEISSAVSIDVNVTLHDVMIKAPKRHAAFMIPKDFERNVSLTLVGINNLGGGEKRAGVQKNVTEGKEGSVGKLTIMGGTLIATGGTSGAGIGGGSRSATANIEITGGSINAIGGHEAAGIGGGFYSRGSNITISGGTVYAAGGNAGAGIGGSFTAGTDITISGGTVTALGGDRAAGIGGGAQAECRNIRITGGKVTASGQDGGAGIGSGANIFVSGQNARNITISGGTVIATGGGPVHLYSNYGGAGIGGGCNSDGTDIEISGGTVTATGTDRAAGIGGGAQGSSSAIRIKGGSVKAVGGENSENRIGAEPTDGNGRTVSLLVIDNPSGDEVRIDGRVFNPRNHMAADANDTRLYAYLPHDLHTVTAGGVTSEYEYSGGRFKQYDRSGMKVTLNSWIYGSPNEPEAAAGGSPVFAQYRYTGRGTTDYAESVSRPADAGDYTVTARYEDDQKIYLAASDFTISPKNIEDVVFDPVNPPSYDGRERKLEFGVKDGSVPLSSVNDYSVAEGSNTAVNVGNNILTIHGKGNYTGTKSLTWSLTKAAPERFHFNIPALAPLAYDETAKVVAAPEFADPITNPGSTVTVYYEGTDGTDYARSEAAPVNVGNYRVTFTMDGGGTNLTATEHDMEIGVLEITDAGHRWDEGTVTIEPTCTQPGEKTFTCSYGHEEHTMTDPVPPLEHDIVYYDAQAPTCTETGWHAYETCSRCGYTTYQEITATGHNLQHVEAVPATVEEAGNTEYWHCTDCGRYFSDALCRNEISLADTVLAKLEPEIPDSPLETSEEVKETVEPVKQKPSVNAKPQMTAPVEQEPAAESAQAKEAAPVKTGDSWGNAAVIWLVLSAAAAIVL